MEREVYNNSTKITVDEVGGYLKVENDGKETVYDIGIDLPRAVGWYQIGKQSQFRIEISPKPSWLARTMCRVLLQWRWIDNDKTK